MDRKKLSKEEIENLSFSERWEVCTCEFGVPVPSYIDPDCPLHWENAPEMIKALRQERKNGKPL